MDIFANLLLGLSIAITPINLAYLMLGAAIGMLVGIIPGFGPSAALAILLPVTFGMDPTGAVIMLAAIYYASQYGGTITSILLNTPGESSSVASTFDGYPLAQQGRAGPALVMQAVASFVGGT
ncbi:MAG TPA: tripartite tricarboxylate transporter permease, partial [Burkholderiales bacterium]|nr:tripartite tricarboxylate transporter permease [Burkholderiales bacterium]